MMMIIIQLMMMKGPGVLLPAVPALRVRARRLHRLAGAGGLRSDDIYIYM